MSEKNEMFIYSPPLLTENGVFEVTCDGRKFITKKSGILTLIDSISLAVIEKFSTYPEAKGVKFSPNSQYISFIDNSYPITVKVIDIDLKEVYTVEIDQNISIEFITWSKNSEFVVFFSELDVYVGVYRVGKDKVILDGYSSDEYKQPLCCFNPDIEYFSVIRNDSLLSYCTDTWELHSIIKCPVNPVGVLYTDVYTIAVWTSSGTFVVLSLLGEKKFTRTSTFSSRIRSAKLCQKNRVLVLATYDDKVELFDVLSWERLYAFEYPLELNETNTVIWREVEADLQFIENQFAIDYNFEKTRSLHLSTIKNFCDEFKMKAKCKFMLSISKANEFLASFCPGFPNVVWVRSLKNGNLAGAISINEGTIQGLRWHPTKEILAVLTLDSIIFWTESNSSVIYCKYLLASFHWIKAKLTICGIATEKEVKLVKKRGQTIRELHCVRISFKRKMLLY